MALSDRVSGDPVQRPDRRLCPTGRMVAGMDETERAAFDKLKVTVPSWTELHYILRDEGYHVDRGYLIRHMEGRCICGPE